MTSCADKLDLSPQDWYGAGNFWTTEAQAIGNISAQMATFRSFNYQNTRLFGELRGGAYVVAGSDGVVINDIPVIEQNLSQTNYGVANFGGYWKAIADANLFIDKVEESDLFSKQETKDYCLGMVYGMRAYYYFIMYRNYGGVPLRLVPDVENGNYDVSTLYKGRAKASEVLAQIKSDIQKSLQYFGSQTTFDFNGSKNNAKYYWSKAATEMLAGEVYLWSAKVAVGDQAAILGNISATVMVSPDIVGGNAGEDIADPAGDLGYSTGYHAFIGREHVTGAVDRADRHTRVLDLGQNALQP